MQGLNIVASVFLYVMPEIDAFFTLRQFITHHCPLYYKKTQKGVRSHGPTLFFWPDSPQRWD